MNRLNPKNEELFEKLKNDKKCNICTIAATESTSEIIFQLKSLATTKCHYSQHDIAFGKKTAIVAHYQITIMAKYCNEKDLTVEEREKLGFWDISQEWIDTNDIANDYAAYRNVTYTISNNNENNDSDNNNTNNANIETRTKTNAQIYNLVRKKKQCYICATGKLKEQSIPGHYSQSHNMPFKKANAIEMWQTIQQAREYCDEKKFANDDKKRRNCKPSDFQTQPQRNNNSNNQSNKTNLLTSNNNNSNVANNNTNEESANANSLQTDTIRTRMSTNSNIGNNRNEPKVWCCFFFCSIF